MPIPACRPGRKMWQINIYTMKKLKNPNNHKIKTPSTAGARNKRDDRKFTSYDTTQDQTSTPQKVREEIEPEGEQARFKKSEK
jgi:hypothetical protein